ncbi:MAG TPA: hypothetical protein ENO36_00385 [Fervidicoccus fontis]|uniref:Uncharacterized protein n=1 Tax=Fervidicoccus fontis TaxID=683846 RepID=A0A7C2YCZ6_9CREN|nr:hypothetical protein [Fervidicoccus fontis]
MLVETGIGIDQHGQNPTKAAVKAVKDAISRVCIPYLMERGKEFAVYVEIGVPHSSAVEKEEIAKALPGGECYRLLGVEVREGGLSTRCIKSEDLGDRGDEMIIAVAAITVLVRE